MVVCFQGILSGMIAQAEVRVVVVVVDYFGVGLVRG